jgi:hypothetical protein
MGFWRSLDESRTMTPGRDHPLVAAWVDGEHEDARRLLRHVEERDDVRFRLSLNRRPWVPGDPDDWKIPDASTPGFLWTASWTIGRGALRPIDFWRRVLRWGDELLNPVVAFAQDSPASINVVLSNADDSDDLADTIGCLFDIIVEEAPAHFGDRGLWDSSALWMEDEDELPARFKRVGPLVHGIPLEQRRYFSV